MLCIVRLSEVYIYKYMCIISSFYHWFGFWKKSWQCFGKNGTYENPLVTFKHLLLKNHWANLYKTHPFVVCSNPLWKKICFVVPVYIGMGLIELCFEPYWQYSIHTTAATIKVISFELLKFPWRPLRGYSSSLLRNPVKWFFHAKGLLTL